MERVGRQSSRERRKKLEDLTGPAVEYAEGGNYCRVRIPRAPGRTPPPARRPITSFTKRSRRSLLRTINSIDRRTIGENRVRLVTLTYPESFPAPREAKRHLRAVLERFRREWGDVPALWKLEPQERGAPHFHLLVFMPAGDTYPDEVGWWARAWCEVVGSTDFTKHLTVHLGKAGHGNRPCVEVVRTWNGVAAYASKYLCKPVDGAGWESPGRWWGKHCEPQLPITMRQVELSPRAAAILRRALVRYHEHQPSGRYRLEDLHSGKIRREYWTPSQVYHLREIYGGAARIRPYHRRWKFASGGIGIFVAASVAERLLAWATATAAEPPKHQHRRRPGGSPGPSDSEDKPGVTYGLRGRREGESRGGRGCDPEQVGSSGNRRPGERRQTPQQLQLGRTGITHLLAVSPPDYTHPDPDPARRLGET